MSALDLLLAAGALGGAGLLLVRSFAGKRRGCAGCHGGSCCSGGRRPRARGAVRSTTPQGSRSLR